MRWGRSQGIYADAAQVVRQSERRIYLIINQKYFSSLKKPLPSINICNIMRYYNMKFLCIYSVKVFYFFRIFFTRIHKVFQRVRENVVRSTNLAADRRGLVV